MSELELVPVDVLRVELLLPGGTTNLSDKSLIPASLPRSTASLSPHLLSITGLKPLLSADPLTGGTTAVGETREDEEVKERVKDVSSCRDERKTMEA